jgi:hypothetical protein
VCRYRIARQCQSQSSEGACHTNIWKGLTGFCFKAELLFDKAVANMLASRRNPGLILHTLPQSESFQTLAICYWRGASMTLSSTATRP